MPVNTQGDRPSQLPKPKQIGGSLLLWLSLLLLINSLLFRQPPYVRKPYSEFIQQVQAGQVAKAEVGSDRIIYTLKGSQENAAKLITTPVVNDLELPKILRDHQVEFSALSSSELNWIFTLLGWILPPLLFFSLWSWFMGRGDLGGSALTVGKSNARIYAEGNTGVTFDDVAGVDEAKVELQEIVDFLKNAEKYARLGAKIPKGVLLIGPPGTGKTLLAKAIAGEAGVPFFSISGSEFIELFVGVGAARVRDLFDQAKNQAPCIVFIDELDALGKSRATGGPMLGGNDEREQTLNQLLSEMDGFDPNTGVILLAATNRPEVLDPALRRPGRFDRQILVDRPDKLGREAILCLHAKSVKLADDVSLSMIAARTSGFAGADLANLVNEAALLAARLERSAVTMADFNEAIERVVAGLQKRSRVLNEMEKRTVAYHEVGHALIGAVIPHAGKVEKISIIPRGLGALGYTLQMPEEDRFLMTESEIRGQLAMLLAGRTAEELIFGTVSTGASDDIQKATDLAERFVTLYGMSAKLGPIAFDRSQQSFLEGYPTPRRTVSDRVAEAIDTEVKLLIEGAHGVAKTVLATNRGLLETMAETLLKSEVLEGADLQTQLAQVVNSPQMKAWLAKGTAQTSLPDLVNTYGGW
ncbi:ATP-dependent zinc metalloprotease FtsH [Alkalinema sp. FACHB-956]|uniref:ATP-dependent zinc metalloprotease FtsH n=1 Tax=Alkalinema sp. FACHB-956 TaxID=2692768 RepID=UPI001686B2B7|nr:ATP-dependent zinc metalloprotease FtsH [Alkalinema sp. FACHB-956]MBD2328093.1 ATP-dependent metallopeptidase FtsH/Yme1/Tma family protein [Alkalinema sp. FACHB-956]